MENQDPNTQAVVGALQRDITSLRERAEREMPTGGTRERVVAALAGAGEAFNEPPPPAPIDPAKAAQDAANGIVNQLP